MRKLHRPKLHLPTLAGTGKAATKAAEHVRERSTDPTKELTFPDYWNEGDVRGALLAMQGWACAYCLRRLENDRGDVDHFRPKRGADGVVHQGYWWLAYSFENYLLACRICNSSCKGNKFPLEEGTAHSDYLTRASLPAEARLLVDPCEDPVDEWMRVDWMSVEEEGFVRVRPILREGSTEERRASSTIHFFRLNEDIEVLRPRVLALRKAVRAIREGQRETVHRLACRYLPHGGAVRNLVEDWDATWLPTPTQELLVLLGALKAKLRHVHTLLSRFPDSGLCVRAIEVILWAFAVVWKDSPPNTMTAAEVAQWLDTQGLKQLVEARYADL